MKLKHVLILQNKIDLVKETQATEQHEQVSGTTNIISVCARVGVWRLCAWLWGFGVCVRVRGCGCERETPRVSL
jgi:hypothetical protein